MTRTEAIAIRTAQLQGVPVTARELREAMEVLSNTSKRGRPAADPWGLTAGQRATLAAITEHGTNDDAAVALGISPKTVSTHLERAMVRMGMDKRLIAILEWDRFVRAQESSKWAEMVHSVEAASL